MAKDLELAIRIAARDEASRALGKVQGAIKGVGAAVAAYFSVRAVSGFFGSAIGLAADLQSQLSELGSVTGATGEDIARLKEEAEQLGASDTINVTTAEAAQAMTVLGRAGQSTSEILASIGPVLAMAQANQLDFAQSASIATQALAQFQLGAEETGRVADVLTRAAQGANTDVSQLGQALGNVGATAEAFGLTFEQTVAVIGQLQNAGIGGAEAGTALKSALSQLFDPASKASQALSDAGVNTRNLDEVLRFLASGTPQAEAALVAFGTEAGPGLRALLGQGVGALHDYRQSLLDAAGAAEQTSTAMGDNLKGAVNGLASVWESLKQTLSDPLLEPIEREVRALTTALSEFAASPAFEQLRQGLVAAFQAAAAAVREFAGQVDWGALGQNIAAFARDASAALAQFQQGVSVFGTTVRTAFDAVMAVFRAVQQSVELVAAAVTGALSLIMRGVASTLEGLAQLGLASESSAMKARAAQETLAQATQDLVERAGRHYQDFQDHAAAALGAVAESSAQAGAASAELGAAAETAAGGVETLAAAAGLTADELDAMGAGASFAADGQSGLGEAAQGSADAVTAAGAAATSAGAAQQQMGASAASAAGAEVSLAQGAQQAAAASAQAAAAGQTQAAAAQSQAQGAYAAAAAAQEQAYQASAVRAEAAAAAVAVRDQAAADGELTQAEREAIAAADAATAAKRELEVSARNAATAAREQAQAMTESARATSGAGSAAARAAGGFDALAESQRRAAAAARQAAAAENAAAAQRRQEAAAERRAAALREEAQATDDAAFANRRYTRSYSELLQRASQERGIDIPVVGDEAQAALEAFTNKYASLIDEMNAQTARGFEPSRLVDQAVQAAQIAIRDLNDEDTESEHRVNVLFQAPQVSSKEIPWGQALRAMFHTGGQVPQWETVPGSGHSDSVAADLRPGTYVLRKGAVQHYGHALLRRVMRFASGGLVPTVLTPGERLFPPETVSRLGVGFFNALNRLEIPRASLQAPQALAGGGVAGGGDSMNVNLSVGGSGPYAMQTSRGQANALAAALRDLSRSA